jgi:hypothetical protein
MEEMTMDMGGAAVVAGVMRTLALRKARGQCGGLVGLVENMPDGRAQRPGDVVRSMKGDTIEVINTDAEGRLVLADVLWYAQDRFKPSGMIDLATLTGAIIVALGHENTGVFSNDDDLCNAFLAAARAEGEGAWRMPMGEAYDAKLKSRIADMINVGGRDGGAITAAQFLRRFVKPDMPWCHLDIAGTALLKSDTTLAPKGATGWGVMALNRLIRDRFETDRAGHGGAVLVGRDGPLGDEDREKADRIAKSGGSPRRFRFLTQKSDRNFAEFRRDLSRRVRGPRRRRRSRGQPTPGCRSHGPSFRPWTAQIPCGWCRHRPGPGRSRPSLRGSWQSRLRLPAPAPRPARRP